jgi:hypothetical protein
MADVYSIAPDPQGLGRDVDNLKFSIEIPNTLNVSVAGPYPAGTYKVTVKVVDDVTMEFGYGFFNVVIYASITDFILNQTNTPNEGDPISTLIGDLQVTGGTAPFVFALIAGFGDGDNPHYQINLADLELSGTGGSTEPTDSIYARVTDANGDEAFDNFIINLDAPGAPLATIGTPNADPTLFIKVESANAGGTALFPYNFLDEDFTDGETKEVYGTYVNVALLKSWTIGAGDDSVTIADDKVVSPASYTVITANSASENLRRGKDNGDFVWGGYFAPDASVNVVSTTIVAATPNDVLDASNYGEVVFDISGGGNHVKITISEGNGW